MKKCILSIILALLSFASQGQINFVEGYFITNEGKTKQCLIKNNDWRNNPLVFEYKLHENEEVISIGISEVSEFSMSNIKYVRAFVDIDLSSNELSKMSYKKNPEYVKKEVFLKEIVQGPVKLYKYTEHGITKYFFCKKNGVITPLVYKKYLIGKENKIGENLMYKQQLYNEINCNALSINKILPVKYYEKDLVSYFNKNNACLGGEVSLKDEKKKDDFNISVTSGISFVGLSVDNTSNRSVDFNDKVIFRVGIELEYVLPFNNNKWSAFLEPNYQKYKEKQLINEGLHTEENVGVNFSYIEIPIGVRHRFFIGSKNNIFVNAGYVSGFTIGESKIDYAENIYVFGTHDPELRSGNAIFGGIGVALFDKIAAEIRFYGDRDPVGHELNYSSAYKATSVIISYNLF